MRHARHDQALHKIEAVAGPAVKPHGQKYIVIVYDGPNVWARDASFVSNVPREDVGQVCQAIIEQIKTQSN